MTIGAEVTSALATAHARGVVHRDVTPGNVMLTATGVKVVDFGISALVGEKEKGPDGTLLGTPAYLAPERLDNGQVSPATDVYAVGLLLYRMLTGRLPWQAAPPRRCCARTCTTSRSRCRRCRGCPTRCASWCGRCLAKRPGDRPATPEVARTLAEAAGMIAAVPVSPAPGPVDEDALAAAGTTILPWSAATDALPFSRTRNRRAATRRRRIEAGVAAAGLVAVTAALWGVTSHSPASGGIDQPTEARMGAETPPPCRVTYALRTDSGKDFAAELTLTNTGMRELRDWRLSFTFPGQQTVTKATPVPVRQQGRTVLVEPAPERAALAPGASEKLTLTGRHSGANPLPLEFRLGDETCGAQVSGVAGAAPSVAPTTAPAKAPAKAPTVKTPTKKAGTSAGNSGGSKAKSDNPGKGKGKAGGGKKVSQETEGKGTRKGTMTTTEPAGVS